jgi:hypothetical protein
MAPLAGGGRNGLGFFSPRYDRVCKGRAAFTAKSKRCDVLFAALGAAQQELGTAFATELSVGRVFAPAFRAPHGHTLKKRTELAVCSTEPRVKTTGSRVSY